MELNNVVDDDKRIIGEISSSTLAYCDEAVAAAIMTLSSGDLMAYIDCGGPPENLIGSSSSSSASGCSSNDESRLSRKVSGRSLARWSDAITCYPGSLLVAVLIQALAHHASSIWVIDEDLDLVGVVKFKVILKVFWSIANARLQT
ncbi:hypothetical protein BC332_18413 [Capsicum chinense]|nr:hypothetical protein BC332_18413 [Capsicum chinense]